MQSNTPPSTLSKDEAEERFLAAVDTFDETPPPDEDSFSIVEPTRFEAKPPEVPTEDESEPAPTGEPEDQSDSPRGAWSDTPSVRQQYAKHPDTVRLHDRTSIVLNLNDQPQLEKLNDLQRQAEDQDNPKVVIIDYERQFHKGTWSVFLTYAKIQYQKI